MSQVAAPVPVDPLPKTAALDLESVLASCSFERAPTLKRLLAYLWQHRGEEISEYAIATEVLKRRSDFEAKLDATVRVQVSRLRKQLKEFYDTDGSHLSTRIVIPIGTHQIKVLEAEQTNKPEPDGSLPAPTERVKCRPVDRLIIQLQFAVIAGLIIFTGWLMWQRHQTRDAAAQSSQAPLPLFWRQFLGNGKSTRIIVPNPVFFRFANNFMTRDTQVNHFSDLKDSSFLTAVSKQFGKPSLAQEYVASSDAFASLQLNRFLDSRQQQLAISTTAETTAAALDRENVIVTGTPHTLSGFPQVLGRLSFEVDSNRGLILNRQPAPGEPREIDTVSESNERIVTPGVIASLPGTDGAHLLILLTTYHTSALVSYLTSDEGLRELQEAQAKHGHCQYFQAVIMSEINGTTPLASRLAMFRSYSEHFGQQPSGRAMALSSLSPKIPYDRSTR